MRALSIQQPWAWLIVNGHKDIENRDWSTNFRGEFLIHASKSFDHSSLVYLQQRFPKIELPLGFEMGGIVGIATLVDCVESHQSKWFVGDYGFVLEKAFRIPFIPCKGQLRFFDPKILDFDLFKKHSYLPARTDVS